MSTFNNTR